ncbi:hypothetical protein SLEP1_g17457 [Rubroshorea leprosula]|uniref:RNase H type-1 domain-containing protein n=1 Tax=Rubroshorea leprosula TaxID=152421 RepID=A0AAV5J383_9ROSI|nr:hypothetical protein SLEP1_g17457 [Rubroshorea leprosula]
MGAIRDNDGNVVGTMLCEGPNSLSIMEIEAFSVRAALQCAMDLHLERQTLYEQNSHPFLIATFVSCRIQNVWRIQDVKGTGNRYAHELGRRH